MKNFVLNNQFINLNYIDS